MDAESEKMCLEEIDHAVLDNDKKVYSYIIVNYIDVYLYINIFSIYLLPSGYNSIYFKQLEHSEQEQ